MEQDKMERTLKDKVGVAMRLTKAQQRSVLRKFQENPDGHPSYRSMRRSCIPDFGWNDTAMLNWCGMWIGIEPDGHTHS